MWEERLKLYDRLIAANPEFERRGKTVPYTSANGHMFSQLNRHGEIGIRLPPQAADRFRAEHGAQPFMSYGSVMKDYVAVPDRLLGDFDALSQLLKESYDHIMTLKPKGK